MGDSTARDAGKLLAGARGARAPQFHIDRSGTWHYLGSPIRREAMVRLFASLLRRTEDGYVLETPDQRIRISVEDAPFVVIDSDVAQGEDGETRVVLRNNLGEEYVIGATFPLELRVSPATGERIPYQLQRDGMPALVGRAVFYRLVELATEDAVSGRAGIRSDGRFFPLG